MKISKKFYVKVSEIVENFDLKVIHKGNLDNKIAVPGLYRAGIELAGKKVFDELSSVVMWSSVETKFLDMLKNNNQKLQIIKNVIDMKPPMILLTKNFGYEKLVKKAVNGTNVVVCKTPMESAESNITIATFISEKIAKYNTIHGTLLNIYGKGVLLKGDSGVGKSEIAMELIKQGHIFVADDAIDVTNFAGKLLGHANAIANEFIEVRGLGILNIPRMFGLEKISDSSQIDVVVELVKVDNLDKENFERLGNNQRYISIEKVKLPYYKLPVSPGRKISDLIETVVVDLKLKGNGYNSAEEYIANYEKIIGGGK